MTTKKQRQLIWLATLASHYWLVFVYLYRPSQGSSDLLKFWIGFLVFTSLVSLADDFRKQIQKRGRSVPAWVAHAGAVWPIVALASEGHFVMAGALAFVEVAGIIAFDVPVRRDPVE